MKRLTVILMIILTVMVSCAEERTADKGNSLISEIVVPEYRAEVTADLVADVVDTLEYGIYPLKLYGNLNIGYHDGLIPLTGLPIAMIEYTPPNVISITGFDCTTVVTVDLETMEWTTDGGCGL